MSYPWKGTFGVWTLSDSDEVPHKAAEFAAYSVEQGYSVTPDIYPWGDHVADHTTVIPGAEPGGSPAGNPGTGPLPSGQPNGDPSAEPDLAPGQRPRPRPSADPYQSPTYSTQWGPKPGGKPKPLNPPGLEIETFPSNNPGPSPRPVVQEVPGTRQPPPDKTKERKTIANVKGHSLIGRAVSAITEGADAIDSFWKALPKKYRTPNGWKKINGQWRRASEPNPAVKARDLYEHWDKVDLKEALTNLAKDNAQDMLIGAFNRRMTKNLRDWYDLSKRPVGLGTGPAF